MITGQGDYGAIELPCCKHMSPLPTLLSGAQEQQRQQSESARHRNPSPGNAITPGTPGEPEPCTQHCQTQYQPCRSLLDKRWPATVWSGPVSQIGLLAASPLPAWPVARGESDQNSCDASLQPWYGVVPAVSLSASLWFVAAECG